MMKSRATAEQTGCASPGEVESAYAWTRLLAALLLSTIGGVGMWSVIGRPAGGVGGVRCRTLRCVAALHDLTGSYQAALVNGVLWNLLNMAIALWLVRRSAGYSPASPARAATSGTRSRSSTRS
jgi:hypothetical protein